jgi:pimeloyl-ACP methyl ester carboxylesterase
VVRLVVNDIGPLLEGAALARIGDYVGLDPKFETFAQLEQHIRTVSASFGPLTDAQWRRLSETMTRRLPDGRYALAYDPGIAVPFRAHPGGDTDLWPTWDAIQCPTLLLRGAQSDLLSAATAALMQQRGPKAELVEVPGVGHAPALQDSSQVEIVARFLTPD